MAGACVAATAVVAGAVLVSFGGSPDHIAPLRTVQSPTLSWTVPSESAPFGPSNLVMVHGGPAGFLAITQRYSPDLVWDQRYGGDDVWFSADGEHWSLATPPGLGARRPKLVAATDDALWVVADAAVDIRDRHSEPSAVYRTTDGTHWSVAEPGLNIETVIGAGRLLVAALFTEHDISARTAVSTDGATWTVLDAQFPELTGPISATAVDGTTYILRTDEWDSPDPGFTPGPPERALFASVDGTSWTELPAPSGSQLVPAEGTLYAVQETPSGDCGIASPSDTAPSESGPIFHRCDITRSVEWFDVTTGTWQHADWTRSWKDRGIAGTVAVGGRLVTALVADDTRLLVLTTTDSGSWTEVPDRAAVPGGWHLEGRGPFVASNGRDVVAMLDAGRGRGVAILVGHPAGTTP